MNIVNFMVFKPTQEKVTDAGSESLRLHPEEDINQADKSTKVRNSNSLKHLTYSILYRVMVP